MHNLTLPSPLSSGFASLRSVLGPFGNVDMTYVPVPASLLQWYQATQDALTTLLVTDPVAQAAFVAIPQKQYIGQFPKAFAQSGIAFEGGNVLCGNDQASAPINFWSIVASPIFRAFSTSNACYRLVFEFFEPDEFLLLFALSGFGASHDLGRDTLASICHYDYSPGDNCGGIYNDSVAFLTTYNASTLSAFPPLARAAERDVKALNDQFLQYLKNASVPSSAMNHRYLFRINILDDADDISWVYFGWCFMYAWASGLREVVSFQGDHGTLTAISGPLSTITMQANPAEVRQDLANVLSLSVQYITMVFLVLATFTALYAISSRGRIEGLNLFEMNRTFGLVWVGRPFVLIRSASAMIILHTNVLNLSQIGAFTVFTSPTILWYNLVLAAGELNWLVYVFNDSFSCITTKYTAGYAMKSTLSAWLILIVWTAIQPCEHVAYMDRRCVAIDMDVGLRCHSAFVEVGFVNRIGLSVLICFGCVVASFLLEKYVCRGAPVFDATSLMLSAPAKYTFVLDDWVHNGVLYIDKPSTLMAGVLSVEYAGGIYLFDVKKWRLLVAFRHSGVEMVLPDARFMYAIPLVE
ncbi:hypothetical protein SPRG_21198 [Saprolegnia parasitica CBS 223.65]|uniref:Transmembrane protein n=1 Tax=Saprolegnia parasitica (strain CBS 223.65) TaxID=695850 RepID=A0A067BUJ3_SAPPC|nr:hypothetical protein SPRG_21198 [Saprolegnia parasitica CBS 223.65]KDO21948.1 hypothetical protein SPRG_21198 [Saprolegnia parasitica CBS 223.65]|eukprot:XP_012207333.1 hypothetical protein SPRG_21198 [Saprolegnia parasitica CBS 223.65]